MGFPAAISKGLGVGKGSTAGTHQFHRGGMENPLGKAGGDGAQGRPALGGGSSLAWKGWGMPTRTGHGPKGA